MEHKSKKVIRIHPAPPTALTQEIPTPDIAHTFEVPPRAFGDSEARLFPAPEHGTITSDVLGSYTGTPADGDDPVQDADDL